MAWSPLQTGTRLHASGICTRTTITLPPPHYHTLRAICQRLALKQSTVFQRMLAHVAAEHIPVDSLTHDPAIDLSAGQLSALPDTRNSYSDPCPTCGTGVNISGFRPSP